MPGLAGSALSMTLHGQTADINPGSPRSIPGSGLLAWPRSRSEQPAQFPPAKREDPPHVAADERARQPVHPGPELDMVDDARATALERLEPVLVAPPSIRAQH